MASSEQVKCHPQLLGILAAVLEGRPLRQVAEAFALPETELLAYCREAGLVPGQKQDPEPQPPAPEVSLQRDPALGPEKELEAAPPRQPVSASVHAERQRPYPEAHPYQDESRAGLRQLLDQAEVERQGYETQPAGPRLREDPLGPPGFAFHRGIQPHSRLVALAMREQAQRQARRDEWFQDPFHWHQEPPAWWFDQ